jgi:beta-N-acetylhexosaminidase
MSGIFTRLFRLLPVSLAVAAFVTSSPALSDDKPISGAAEQQLRAMIGQMVLVGFTGDSVTDKGFTKVRDQAARGEITGVIYLKRNIRNRKTVRAMNDQLQASTNSARPLLTAVDQEGGQIQRLTSAKGFPNTRSASRVAEQMDERAAQETYSRLAANLHAWGFNLNLGPVVDLNLNSANPIIGQLGRSFSDNPDVVVRYATAFVKGHRNNGVLTALKHFPGHGSSAGDSHKGTVDVTATWQKQELSPYKDLIRDGFADMVMSSHVVNAKLGSGNASEPSSLSKATITGILRGQLEFRGVVISDDLQMSAIAGTRSLRDAVVQAVSAGNDILVFANDKNPDPLIPNKVADILVKEAATDKQLLSRIAQASANVQNLKDKWAAKNLTDAFRTKSIETSRDYRLITPAYVASMERNAVLTVH